MSDSSGSSAKKPLAVYAIIERKDRKSYWFKVGAAFTNRDGSITLYLDAVPIGTNRLQVREQRAWEEGRPVNGHPSLPTAEVEVLP
jgi:hypothetical protein